MKEKTEVHSRPLHEKYTSKTRRKKQRGQRAAAEDANLGRVEQVDAAVVVVGGLGHFRGPVEQRHDPRAILDDERLGQPQRLGRGWAEEKRTRDGAR